jgi:hypothetical protein
VVDLFLFAEDRYWMLTIVKCNYEKMNALHELSFDAGEEWDELCFYSYFLYWLARRGSCVHVASDATSSAAKRPAGVDRGCRLYERGTWMGPRARHWSCQLLMWEWAGSPSQSMLFCASS